MKQYLLGTIFSLLAFSTPALAAADNEDLGALMPAAVAAEGQIDDAGEASLTMRGNAVHIQNAQGATLEVFDITGKRVLTARIDSNEKTIPLNLGKGCYILRVGKLTRKVSLA